MIIVHKEKPKIKKGKKKEIGGAQNNVIRANNIKVKIDNTQQM